MPARSRESGVVYTALFGGYERLNETQAPSSLKRICFTDDPSLTSGTWEVRVVAPAFALDPQRSQRKIKILGHPSLAAYDTTLYIDNTVSLLRDPADLITSWLSRHDVAIPRHSFRRTVADEFEAVMINRLAEPERIVEQFEHYAAECPGTLVARPLWNGMIARRPSPRVDAAFEAWYEHVLRYSRRDQLSVRAGFLGHAFDLHEVEIDNHSSTWHSWPADCGRRHASPVTPPRTPAVDRQTREAIAEARRLLLAAKTQRGADVERNQRAILSSVAWPVRRLARALGLARLRRSGSHDLVVTRPPTPPHGQG